MGENGETAVTGAPTAPPSKLDQFIGGARIWLSPSQVPTALSNLGAGWAASPLSVVGFLLVPAAVLALVLGAAKRRRSRNPRRMRVTVRRVRRRANPRRRVRRRNPKDAPAGYLLEVPGSRPVFYRGRGGALEKAIASGRRKMAGRSGTFHVTDSISARTYTYTAAGTRRSNPGARSRRVRGSDLTPAAKRQVLGAYGYRWTVENERRAREWFHSSGHEPPRAALVTDAQWLADHSFAITSRGELSLRDKWAAPHYMANPSRRATKKAYATEVASVIGGSRQAVRRYFQKKRAYRPGRRSRSRGTR
jgi:hypothetical protein